MATPSSTKTTLLFNEENKKPTDFDSIRLRIASPEDILDWSYGEITKPETINYRTLKPEKDGLFCERIFGPSKDWECYCGKYKRVRYKGLTCDRCGVDVTRSSVRRERMGHIALESPVSHIWFLRGIPSKLGLLLDLSVQDLEKVIYFASYIVTSVDESMKESMQQQVKDELKQKQKQLQMQAEQRQQSLEFKKSKELEAVTDKKEQANIEKKYQEQTAEITFELEEKLERLKEVADSARKELNELSILEIFPENRYHELSLKYGHIFNVGIGAEAIRELVSKIDLPQLAEQLDETLKTVIASKRKKLIRRLALVKNLIKNSIKPEWMVISILPVIPPELRPMVPLDGGRYATSDLNDLYRRVINRNNRLRKLKDLNAPEVIRRNEKRMLQEAVDALIDNSARHGKTVTASTGQKRQLKSIANMLKGKQGRFRQNLLGKRVDYSGRSVIVVGPYLKLYQCGLPKRMALELFRPFVIAKLIEREYVHNVRSANRFIESNRFEVWDILEEVTSHAHVLLNRAPTLHRLGIQAFQPILIEGKAIHLHPLVCKAFNADFDGDQMAVHVPLTESAKAEAAELMLASKNLLSPATGKPITSPAQDMVWGAFYMTYLDEASQAKKFYTGVDEALQAYQIDRLHIQEKIIIEIDGTLVQTSIGRVLFNQIVPEGFPFINKLMKGKDLNNIIDDILNDLGDSICVKFLDDLKNITYKNITLSGMSFGAFDAKTVVEKEGLVKEGERRVEEVWSQFDTGLLTDHERYVKTTEVWSEIKNKIAQHSEKNLDPKNPIYSMITSGARGSIGQLVQITGMKGLVTNTAGEVIELPVKGNFAEGLDVIEFFSSSHGTRKGLADTALRTANAGYLTRRLIDVAQDIIIATEDCGDTEGVWVRKEDTQLMGTNVKTRIFGRYLLSDLKDVDGKVIVKKGTLITKDVTKEIPDSADLADVLIRSVLTCRVKRGLCQTCYGLDLGRNKLVDMGTAVGIIAAQSIGEPGTQLTMRTFHTGGVSGSDITQGLPRIEELFEVRPPKHAAILAPHAGTVRIPEDQKLSIRHDRNIHVEYNGSKEYVFSVPTKAEVIVENGSVVKKGDILYIEKDGTEVKSTAEGDVMILRRKITVKAEGDVVDTITIPAGYALWVKDGELVDTGTPLTEGSSDLRELYGFRGLYDTQKYILAEVQKVYTTQGQNLNDKHIEIIIRQLFSRCMVLEGGDSKLVPGDIITKAQYLEALDSIEPGQKKPKIDQLLLGLTKASLNTDSWLSAASFQETNRVLVEASVTGKHDYLRGLKENVIIGRLIPCGTGFNKNKKNDIEEEYDSSSSFDFLTPDEGGSPEMASASEDQE